MPPKAKMKFRIHWRRCVDAKISEQFAIFVPWWLQERDLSCWQTLSISFDLTISLLDHTPLFIQAFDFSLNFALASLPLPTRSRMLSRSLSSFNFVTTTLDGWTPIGTLCPLLFSRETRSMCRRYFSRYTEVTLPSRPFIDPRVTSTSSSLRMGIERTWLIPNLRQPTESRCRQLSKVELELMMKTTYKETFASSQEHHDSERTNVAKTPTPLLSVFLTLCFSRSSLLNGALMIVRRTLEGAPKWAFRDFLRAEWIARSRIIKCQPFRSQTSLPPPLQSENSARRHVQTRDRWQKALTGIYFRHGGQVSLKRRPLWLFVDW